MKIAFTGTSSTGKTTLANALREDSWFVQRVPEFVTTDARRLLREGGFKQMDEMPLVALRSFQLNYFRLKEQQEYGLERFMTDRSFVDVGAYWWVRDSLGLPDSERRVLMDKCRAAARRYDIHFYFPFGLFPFQHDGYRSVSAELHRAIDSQILFQLEDWGIEFIRLDERTMSRRVDTVMELVRERA